MNARYENNKVSRDFATFISELKDAHLYVHFIDPIPPGQTQKGFTCGYYAASTVTQYWNKTNAKFLAYFARKSDFPKAQPDETTNTSLRSMGKKIGLNEVGGIFNVEDFKRILEQTDYHCVCPEFETQEDLNFLLQRSLHRNQPVIVPVDIANGISLYTGTRAHYITVFGYFKSDNKSYYIYSTYNQVYTVSEDILFKSCNQLREKPSATFYKDGKEWYKLVNNDDDISNKRTNLLSTQDLSGMRNKLVMIYPASEGQAGLDIVKDWNELSRKKKNANRSSIFSPAAQTLDSKDDQIQGNAEPARLA